MSNLQQLPLNNEGSLEIQLENKVKRYMFLKKNAVKEYEDLKKELKEFFHEVDSFQCGEYKITGKWIHKKEYTVKAVSYWDMRIN